MAKFFIEKDILIVKIEGFWSPDKQLDVQKEAITRLHLNSLSSFLIDLSTAHQDEESSSIFHIYDSGEALKSNYPLGTKFAIVYSKEYEDEGKAKFFNTVTGNRAVAAKAFQDCDEAKAWLIN
ncbi:MAG: hypothetical protein AAF363_16265 [Bacteroidota bacterium]